jgi:hypothetical protein
VKLVSGSKLSATAGALRFSGAAAAGDSKRAAAETATSIIAALERTRLGKTISCYDSDIV